MTCWERLWLKEGEQRQYKILKNDEWINHKCFYFFE
jgi:hypothetical protein